MRRLPFLLVLFVASCGDASTSGPIVGGDFEARVKFERTDTPLGVGIPIEVVIVHRRDLSLEPLPDDLLPPLLLKHLEERHREDATKHEVVHRYLGYAFEAGAITVRLRPVTALPKGGGARRSAEAAEISLTVRSALSESAGAEAELPGPPLSAPSSPRPWLLGLLGLALLGLGVSWLRSRSQKDNSPAAAMPPAPAVKSASDIALERLTTLRLEVPTNTEELQSLYVRSSDVVREYVEQRFSLRPREQTTRELLTSEATRSAISQSGRSALKAFLHHCDLVKFAALHPSDTARKEALDAAVAFVETTSPTATEGAPS